MDCSVNSVFHHPVYLSYFFRQATQHVILRDMNVQVIDFYVVTSCSIAGAY
jgi:hypothetical protein